MIEGTDYCFIYPSGEPKNEQDAYANIKFLQGPYKDTVFKYGKVKFEEKDGQMYLLFAYDVLESPTHKPKKLEKDEAFKNYIGDLLVELMSGNLEQEIIDETGTDNIKEPNL